MRKRIDSKFIKYMEGFIEIYLKKAIENLDETNYILEDIVQEAKRIFRPGEDFYGEGYLFQNVYMDEEFKEYIEDLKKGIEDCDIVLDILLKITERIREFVEKVYRNIMKKE